ncbi:hypothetical protein PQJ75_29890 [Rhodoplanes sp. TEM]|uniref:Uncharacterized protein n=1 Tax=Rhodoplanes tepidamans TaxID=200616 RepID=A0ABT5JDD6_RHOTP|nr:MULTISPECIES: hypothetical protein [Rhodoplanes]MDC7787652.1 hypothetical protein [Rhodoplanes tepidamans]MDC7987965.1 hypothetical protein [Rhodoplanes sp. TEM]MDQ0355222.1 hypothetical protein [Rhodoplanes tepidamans]
MDALTPPPSPSIPLVDLRAGGPPAHVRLDPARARALRDDCVAFFPRGVGLVIPACDGLTRRWLGRSASPYVDEIAAMAETLGISGVWVLNGSYQWACTAIAREEGGAPWLARTLDWPFPGLGRRVTVARLAGPAGAFFSVTWPGFAGVLTGMAPGRFAACINQAPMRRRTLHPWLRLWDMTANAAAAWPVRHMPPDHLLRHAFETCGDFVAARDLLADTPVSRPVIYTLAGTAPGARCVIERTEEGAVVRGDDTTAGNDWWPPRPAWEARMPAHEMLSRSFDDAAAMSKVRQEQIAAFDGDVSRSFDWVLPPILNPYTRISVAMSPAAGLLRVLGWEADGPGLPRPVTAVREVTADAA